MTTYYSSLFDTARFDLSFFDTYIDGDQEGQYLVPVIRFLVQGKFVAYFHSPTFSTFLPKGMTASYETGHEHAYSIPQARMNAYDTRIAFSTRYASRDFTAEYNKGVVQVYACPPKAYTIASKPDFNVVIPSAKAFVQ